MSGQALAIAARSFVGTPFRLHGRDPAIGLDCVGLLDAALRAIGATPKLPSRYALRTLRIDGLDEMARSSGFAPCQGPAAAGDVVIVRPWCCQHHLMIADPAVAFVHAHAGLRRIVVGPVPVEWPIAARFRLT
ncbi:hypothetical protein B2G71_00415 [Novosphingobium sp. PC22D]|uniref:hypothetical protein n=1 Tax=Novosphingobium sp. PC22D TaxID=1962403 RepID=UPI000BFAF24E|nr:hypothetical protein [Novosphingobium sp. PC22D]PEQ14122.1 hypothetical protein B2G71_00415 [Novosphingobium sp. PC22D]